LGGGEEARIGSGEAAGRERELREDWRRQWLL
jgi:hypothetical protein